MGPRDASRLALGQWEVQPGRGRGWGSPQSLESVCAGEAGTAGKREGTFKLAIFNCQEDAVRSSDAPRPAASPAFHQHVCRARRGLRTHVTRTPQPRMRTPGVGFPCRAHSGDQTDLFSSITKAVDVTLSEDSVHFNQRSEQRLFPKPGARSTARPTPWTADRLVGRAPFTQGHAHAVHAAGKTPGAGAGTPGQGTGGHVGALRVTLAMVRSANGNPPPSCTHTL